MNRTPLGMAPGRTTWQRSRLFVSTGNEVPSSAVARSTGAPSGSGPYASGATLHAAISAMLGVIRTVVCVSTVDAVRDRSQATRPDRRTTGTILRIVNVDER